METTDERYAILQDKLKTVVLAFKEERTTNASTIEDLQNELNEEREQNDSLQDKIVKLVELVKIERKKTHEALEQKDKVENSSKADEAAEERAKEQTDALHQDIVRLKETLEKLQLENEEVTQELERQREGHQKTQVEMEKLKQTSKIQLDTHISKNDELVVSLQRENERLSQELQETSTRADTFETKLSTLVTILKDLKAERATSLQRETELQTEIETLRSANSKDEETWSTNEIATPVESVHENLEFKAMQQKVQEMEQDVAKYISTTAELQRELDSSHNKIDLAERTCDRLRDELEKLQNQSTQRETMAPPPLMQSGPPKLPPPPPPPPNFKKISGKLEIKKSTKPPPGAGNAEDTLKSKLMNEISKGVTLRKVQPSSQPKAPNPNENMFSLGAMASMLAQKRMARISMRIDADDPLKGSLDTLLMELNFKK